MRSTRAALVLLLALTIILLAGCAGSVTSTGTRPAGADGAASLPASSAATSASATTPGSAASGANAASAVHATQSIAELATMKSQLNAMQKEIDSLALPSDSDFSSAEGAIY